MISTITTKPDNPQLVLPGESLWVERQPLPYNNYGRVGPLVCLVACLALFGHNKYQEVDVLLRQSESNVAQGVSAQYEVDRMGSTNSRIFIDK